MNREKLLELARNDDERLLLSRICDIARSAEKNHSVKTTQFLNGHELLIAQNALNKSNGVCFSAYGGYDLAERKVIACYPEHAILQFNISIIKVSGRELENLSHRDYLGSILALGIRREKIGDIIINSTGGFIICLDDICDYIISQLEKISSKSVKLSLCEDCKLPIAEKKFKEINGTVSSLRLDAVVSAGTNLSRNDASALIKSGKVTVNWEQVENISYMLHEDQVISVKGFGRMELAHIRGETKKGRIAIVIKRYI